MSQDNKKSFVMYQGDGSNNVFSVPMTKGKYGTISVAFVRRGLDQYEYNPDTWGLNGGLFAWDLSGTKVYTDTATPAIGATIYDQYGVDTGDTVTAVGGATVTVNTDVYTRDTLHDVDENTVLTWTGDTLQVGDYIVIERTTTRTQPFEFQNNQKHIEKSDDNLERQIQEVADKVDNALLVDPTHVIDSNKMNPVEWMRTILRSVDKSVRGFRYLNGWLDYSLDDPNIADVDKTWKHLLNTDNIKGIRERSYIEEGIIYYYTEYLSQDGSWRVLSNQSVLQKEIQQAVDTADEAYALAESLQTTMGLHINNTQNPHQTSMDKLTDTEFSDLQTGQFISYIGGKWKNVSSSSTASWGAIIGNITDQTDLVNTFVKKAGDTMSGALNLENIASSNTALLTLTHSNTTTYKWNIAPRYNSTTLSIYPGSTETNGFRFATTGFVPASNNARYLGSASLKWKGVYTAMINNGGDLVVPAVSGTLATKADVDLAANSGRMITDKGVWYAKMNAATVPPAAEDGTNYADFSQVDGKNNPVIVIYNRIRGAWVQDRTITPPAEYDGYVPITSKIWDIPEQAGQQGGRILWNHQSEEFTPYPQIISLEDVEVTGDSTVVMPQNPGANQIVNKDYVDNHIPTGNFYHPDLFDWKWADHQVNDVQWLRGDTFSWQSGAVYEAAYQHLVDDIDGKTLQSETIGSTTIQFYLADDGHKVCPASEESNVAAIYTATGVAWYYIIDTVNERFKLPRGKHNKYTETLGVVGNGKNTVYTDGTNDCVFNPYFGSSNNGIFVDKKAANIGVTVGTAMGTATNITEHSAIGLNTDPIKTNVLTTPIPQDTDQHKYLYFYVGEFTQTAIENTAGLNAELFNEKADNDLDNVLANIDFVIESQLSTAGNNYTWYRKYRSGWVEMGGQTNDSTDGAVTITLPVQLADANYVPLITGLYITDTGQASNNGASKAAGAFADRTTTSFKLWKQGAVPYGWEVKGMAA